MDKVYEQKNIFIRGKLLQLVQAIDKDVLRLDYRLHKTGEETVTIVYLTSCGEHFKPVNVTGDSLKSLTMDVIRRI